MRYVITLIIGAALTAAAFLLWPKQDADPREHSKQDIVTGKKTTTFEVGEAVTGLKSLNRITVFQAYLAAITEGKECLIWGCPIESSQALISPAFVNYYIDMNAISGRSFSFDATKKRLTIKLPPLMIERPNIDTAHQRIFTDGVLGQITGSASRLEKQTRPLSIKQLYRQANAPFLLNLARKQAVAAVFANARKTLDAGGARDVSLTIGF